MRSATPRVFTRAFGFEPLEVIEGQIEEKPAPTAMFLPIREVAQAIKVAPTR